MSLRDDILAANAPRFERLFIPEWNQHVRIVEMTADDRDSFDLNAIAERDKEGGSVRRIRARLMCACTCDDDGRRIFTDADVDALGTGSSVVADRI